jgi:hypothetical protein
MSDSQARAIPGTDLGALEPTFSPDGLSVAFTAETDGTIKRIGLRGGTAVTVCAVSDVNGMSWGPDGIVYAVGDLGPDRPGAPAILRVSPAGGAPEVLVRGAAGHVALHPQVIADGQILQFTMLNGTGADGWVNWERDVQIVLQTIRTGERHVLLTGGANARYLPSGHLVYAVGGVLYAVRVDLPRFAVTGTATPVIQGIRRGVGDRTIAHYTVSPTGT